MKFNNCLSLKIPFSDSQEPIEETKSAKFQLLVKRKSLRMSWKENLIDEVLKELDNSAVNEVYNIYGQHIPLGTLHYWATHRTSKKLHHKKGKRTKLGYLELLLFEWFFFQRRLGNVMNEKIILAKAERLKKKIMVN